MIQNLQDDFYQLENKQAKGAKLRAYIRWELEGEKYSKAFSKVLERQNLQNQIISELYPKDIFKSAKKIVKHFKPRRQLPKLLLLNVLAKFLTERKFLVNNLTFVRQKYLQIKSINSETNESPGDNGLKAEFHKHVSNELTPVSFQMRMTPGEILRAWVLLP